ncbi:MAG TPA: magnesium chelatase domain-containing protein, partial [Phycisphaerales bacterium]|nr:magnesium chelatase domain-containing protein [Phycisphaerales bacterium]
IEPAADLAICLAIAGAHFSRAVEPGIAVVGEVGLGGEIRRVHQLEQRMREAQRLGYRRLVAAKDGAIASVAGTELIRVDSIGAALELLSPVAGSGSRSTQARSRNLP